MLGAILKGFLNRSSSRESPSSRPHNASRYRLQTVEWRLCPPLQCALSSERRLAWRQRPAVASAFISCFATVALILTIHSALSDDNKADIACSSARMISTLTAGRPVGTIQWTAISAPGAYRLPHRNASGYHAVVQVVDGGVALWAFNRRRSQASTASPRPGSADVGWQWAAFDDSEIFVVALKDRDRM